MLNVTDKRIHKGVIKREDLGEETEALLYVHVVRVQCKVDLLFKQAHLECPFERRVLFAGNSENDPLECVLEPCTLASNEFGPE